MPFDLHSLAWHRSIGKLIMQLNRPEFWRSLIRTLNEYVQIDNYAFPLAATSTSIKNK